MDFNDISYGTNGGASRELKTLSSLLLLSSSLVQSLIDKTLKYAWSLKSCFSFNSWADESLRLNVSSS